jgi:hypothetical protein
MKVPHHPYGRICKTEVNYESRMPLSSQPLPRMLPTSAPKKEHTPSTQQLNLNSQHFKKAKRYRIAKL